MYGQQSTQAQVKFRPDGKMEYLTTLYTYLFNWKRKKQQEEKSFF